MKSFELKPTEENLLSAYKNDQIGRNTDIHAFVDILNSLEDSCSIALDGAWGSGKTFFVKQAKMILESCSPIESKSEYRDEVKTVWKNYHGGKEPEFQAQLCVYYDAWENDNDGDPILSLVYSILQQVDEETPFPKDNKIFEKVAALADCITGKSTTAVLESMKSDSVLDDLRKSKSVHSTIVEFLDHLLDERANRLIVIIDELDRCKPDYAVRVLEKIKHYFDNERITFVFAVNVQELQHTISSYYGSHFDSCRYLDRFFDLRIALPPANLQRYYQSIDFQSDYYTVDFVCKKIIEKFHFSLREISRFLKAMKIAEYELTHSDRFSFSDPEQLTARICEIYLVPLLIALEISDMNAYTQLISGQNPEKMIELCEWIDSSYSGHFRDFLTRDEVYDNAPENEKKDKKVVTLKEKVTAVYEAIFVKSYTARDDYHGFVGNCEFKAETKTYLLRLVSMLSPFSKYE